MGRCFEVGNYYHILNRGNLKQNIFFERENYLFFLRRLRKAVLKFGSEIVCYCLLPNHFHLLMKETSLYSISKVMHSVQTAYAKAINKRYERSGHLYQGSYKHIHINMEDYLLYLSRYIHRNPIEATLVNKAEEWEFSSFRDFIGLRHGSLPNYEVILSHFENGYEYQKYVLEDNDDYDIDRFKLE